MFHGGGVGPLCVMCTPLRAKDLNQLYDFYKKVRLAAIIIYADIPICIALFEMLK
jgi:hypothetical protein